MYSIFCDGVCIHHGPSPDENLKVLEPKLKLSDNAAGTLTFKIPPNNVGYQNIHRLTSEIVVKRKNFNDTYNKVVYEEIWSGRVIEEKEDFWKNREITCEGELGYLNDTTQPPNEYHDITPTTFLTNLISIHNSKCEESKRFTVGIVTVTDPNDSLYRYTNFESTYEAIKDKLLDRLGGHLRIRKENGVRYLDYLQDYPSTNTQTIEFGKNLIEFSKNFDASELVTAIVPLGCNVTELDMEPTYDALEEYLTVESVNGGSIYVSSPEAVENYGWIETVVHWNDVKTPSILLSKARDYLSDAQFEDMSLELSAVDLHSMDIHTEAIWLLDRIRCISKPHGMDRIFPILKIDIPLDKPEDTKYTLGEKVKSTGISASVRDTNAQIIKKIDELPTTSSVLRQAKEESMDLLNMKTNGFITITTEEDLDGKYHSDALYISDIKDVTASNRYWKWNMNGLAYYKNKSELGLALTMDGSIVADRILAGTLGKPEWGNYWNMETGEFILSPTGTKVNQNTTLSSYFDEKITTYDSSLNQQAVFNKLTNNGQTQGIYLSNGYLYINASYIGTGKISSSNGTVEIDLTNNAFNLSAPNIEIKNDGTLSLFGSYYNTKRSRYVDRKMDLSSGNLKFYYKFQGSSDWRLIGNMSAGIDDDKPSDIVISTLSGDSSEQYYDIVLRSGNAIELRATCDNDHLGQIVLRDSKGNNEIWMQGNTKTITVNTSNLELVGNDYLLIKSGDGFFDNGRIDIETDTLQINSHVAKTTGTLWMQNSDGNSRYLEFVNGILVDYSDPW